jgi:pyridoxal phosphate enzyme (YggS family)
LNIYIFTANKTKVDIAGNIVAIKNQLPANVRLVAVSKTKPVEDILAAYYVGQRIFGENKIQELVKKHELLPKDIEWHFIGHPQTNKIRFIAPFVSLIHGVDSLKLLRVINAEAEKCKRKINCLLQFHIANEETKFGFTTEEAFEMLESPEFQKLKNISVCGVMGMATFTDDINHVKNEFRKLKSIFGSLRMKYFQNNPDFCEISMGMSDDYSIAVEEGSTIVRIGSKIFGERNYQH